MGSRITLFSSFSSFLFTYHVTGTNIRRGVDLFDQYFLQGKENEGSNVLFRSLNSMGLG